MPYVTHNEHRGPPVPDGTCVSYSAQPRWVPPNDRNRPIISARYQNVLEKLSTLLTMHLRIRGNKKKIFMAVQQVFLPPNSGSVDMLWASKGTRDATTSLQVLRGYSLNQPQGKHHQYDGSIWTRRNPFPPYRTTQKGVVICKNRRIDNLQRHYGVKRYHPFGTNGNVKQWHQGMEPEIQWNKGVGNIQGFPHLAHIEQRRAETTKGKGG